jgi:hypothetical protein
MKAKSRCPGFSRPDFYYNWAGNERRWNDTSSFGIGLWQWCRGQYGLCPHNVAGGISQLLLLCRDVRRTKNQHSVCLSLLLAPFKNSQSSSRKNRNKKGATFEIKPKDTNKKLVVGQMERHSHMPKWKVTFRDELKKSSVGVVELRPSIFITWLNAKMRNMERERSR